LVASDDAAQVVEIRGVVQSQRKNQMAWNPVQVNQLLWGKDWMRTKQGSGARLRFLDVSTAELGENTEITVEQLAIRRGGSAAHVVLKTWAGTTAIRAVRLVDPSSFFRLDTPTASTVVRGARMTVQVEQGGRTQIDLQQGGAEVQIKDTSIALGMGERISVEPGGAYHKERIFWPNAQLVRDRIQGAWSAPGETFQLELPEDEINQFLVATSLQPDSAIRSPEIWLTADEARLFATLANPAPMGLCATIEIQVVNGELKPRTKLVTAGVAVPVPATALDRALAPVLGQVESYLDQANALVRFDDVRIEEGRVVASGTKRPDAPLAH
jgi:hypothetical protein